MPNKFISNAVLRDLLTQATVEERLSLTNILDKNQKKAFSSIRLQKEISKEGGHGVVNLFRGQGTGYLDIVDDVADELKIKNLPSYSVQIKYYDEIENLKYTYEIAKEKGIKYAKRAEEQVIIKLLELIYEKLDDKGKKNFDQQVNKVAEKFGSNSTVGIGGVAGLSILANMGGFATYTFLTTSLSTLSMGTLGFGAYTASTSLLSVLIGPVGWAGLGVFAAFSLGKPGYEKLLPIVATIGSIRQRIEYEDSNRLETKKETSLHAAVKNNDIEHIKVLLKGGLDVNGVDVSMNSYTGLTPLLIAIFEKNFDLVKFLIENKADLNVKSETGITPLFAAAMDRSLDIVRLLIEKGANVNMKSDVGYTPLIGGIMSGNLEIVKILMQNDADVTIQDQDGYTPLTSAIMSGNLEVVKILIAYGANANLQEGMDKKTALMIASEKGFLDIVKYLIEDGHSDVNITNPMLSTALILSAKEGELEVVKFLIENGADTIIEAKDGFNALMIAAFEGHLKICKLLIKSTSNIDNQSKDGFNALIWAAFSAKIEIVEYLIGEKAKLNIQDNNGLTALMWASIRGHINIVELLYKYEANIHIQSKDKFTALMWASLRGHSNIVQFLIKHNADINAQTKDGKTALDFAKDKENKNIIRLLNPNINTKQKENEVLYKIDRFSFNNFKAFGKKKQTFSKKPITVIYGPNSVGKSSLIHVVAYQQYLQQTVDIDANIVSIFGDELDIGGVEKFVHKRNKNNIIKIEIGIKKFTLNDYSIKIAYTININDLTLIIDYINNNNIFATKRVSYNKKYKIKDEKIQYFDESLEYLVEELDGVLIGQLNSNMQYIGPLRPNPNRDKHHSIETEEHIYNSENLWSLLIDDNTMLDQVNQKLQRLEMNYSIENTTWYHLDNDYNNRNDIEKLQDTSKKEERLVFQDIKKEHIEISNRDLGLGVGQVLPILIATNKHNNKTIAIEQPELHLHPKLQAELADEFIKSYKDNNNEFLIETHSEHLLLRMMRRMRYTFEDKEDRDKSLDLTPQDICLLYVDSDNESTFIKELRLSKKGTLLDHWPNGFFDDGYKERFE